jgi:IclR family acetate operon transcriptional repressor
VQSVERALELLDLLAESGGEAGLSDLAERSGLPMPTVHRLIQTLVSKGFATQTVGRRYGLGLRLVRLGDLAMSQIGTIAEPLLAQLRDITGETSNLARLERNEIVYVAQAPSRHSMRMFTEVGRRVLPHCTAVGKAMLATLPPADVEALVAQTGLPAMSANTITELAVLQTALAKIRKQGYAIDEGEQEIGVRCVAVTVRETAPMYAVSISGPAGRLTTDVVKKVVPELHSIADQLRDALDDD